MHAWNGYIHGLSGTHFPDGKPAFVMKTNLDLAREELPRWFVCLPRVGDDIMSSTSHSKSPAYRLRLRVCNVTFTETGVEVELHVPPPYQTLREFYDVYEKITGRRFI